LNIEKNEKKILLLAEEKNYFENLNFFAAVELFIFCRN